jgi:hypothetical protein
MPWSARFDTPIALPDGRELVTLRDAAEHITALPASEAGAMEWQTAMEILLWVAERNGITMLANIAVLKALHRHRARPAPAPRKKRAKAYLVRRLISRARPIWRSPGPGTDSR